MTTAVIGSGAVGLFLSSAIASATPHVLLLARPHQLPALTHAPIHITLRGEPLPAAQSPTIISNPSQIPPTFPPVRLAILCTKNYDVPHALPTLNALQPATIMTLQNGLGAEETLAAHIPIKQIVAGVITSSFHSERIGHCEMTKRGGIGLAPVHPSTPLPSFLAPLLRASGVVVRSYHDYRALKWSKLLLNILGNAIPALLHMPLEVAYTDYRLVALERQILLEALAVMQRLGLRPQNLPSYPTAPGALLMRRLPRVLLFPLFRMAIARGRGGKLPSLFWDIQHQRPQSEAAALYGAIAQHATHIGIATPLNCAISTIFQQVMTGHLPPTYLAHRPDRLLHHIAAMPNSPAQSPHPIAS